MSGLQTSFLDFFINFGFILHLLKFFQSGTTSEYCLLEDFSPTCPQDSVIFITSARYGRMQLGRCLSRDYHLGCFADVTIQLDHVCTGKRHCHLTVPEPHLLKLVTCPSDLVSYLEADYECIKVNAFDTKGCHATQPILLTPPSGYITSHHFLASTSGIKFPTPALDFPIFPLQSSSLAKHGGDYRNPVSASSSNNNCRWIIVCLPGQKLTLTLYNLHTAREIDAREKEFHHHHHHHQHQRWSLVSDDGVKEVEGDDVRFLAGISGMQHAFRLDGGVDHRHRHHHLVVRNVAQQQQLLLPPQQQEQRNSSNSSSNNCNGSYAVINEHDVTQDRFIEMINRHNSNNNSKDNDRRHETTSKTFLLSVRRKIICLRETRLSFTHTTEGRSVSMVLYNREASRYNNINTQSSYNEFDYAAHDNIMFLLKYSVHGCAKIMTPNDVEVTRYVDGFDVTCNVTTRTITWSYKCSRNIWMEMEGSTLDMIHPPWSRCNSLSNADKDVPREIQQSMYLSRVFGYLRGHETTAWLALFIGVVVGIAFGLGLLVFVSLLKKRLKSNRLSGRCLDDNTIQQEVTCLHDDVIFRRSSSNFSFWHDVSDWTEDRYPRTTSRHDPPNTTPSSAPPAKSNMASIFASTIPTSKTPKPGSITFALVEQNCILPRDCDEMRIKLNSVQLDVLSGTSHSLA